MYIYIKTLKKDEELTNNKNIPIFLQKIIIKLKKQFNLVTVKKIDEKHHLYIIPKKNSIKLIKKIVAKNNTEKVIFSKDLKKYEKEFNLEDKNISIFIPKILQYIMDTMDKKLELQNIYFLVNEYNERNIEIIRYMIDKMKTVNIVTNNIGKFKILEEKIYNEKGILITVTNNKNKSLKRASYIINLDFNNENIKEYRIVPNTIIINCINEKLEILKYFQRNYY